MSFSLAAPCVNFEQMFERQGCANSIVMWWCFINAEDDSNWFITKYCWFYISISIAHKINRYMCVRNSPELSINVAARWSPCISHQRSVIHSEAHLTESGVIVKPNWDTDLHSQICKTKKHITVMRPNWEYNSVGQFVRFKSVIIVIMVSCDFCSLHFRVFRRVFASDLNLYFVFTASKWMIIMIVKSIPTSIPRCM